MATSITNAFVRQYEDDVHDVFQRQGGWLRPTVRTKDGVVGKSTTFQKVGKGTASTKSRHGVVTPMNQDHTALECLLEDFYAGDWVDKLDEAKTNIDERMAIARGGAFALGRKVDDLIFTEMDATTQSVVSISVGTEAAIENSMLDWVGQLDSNDVPNDGMRFGAVSPKMWQFMAKVDEFKSTDYVRADDLPMVNGAPILGRFKFWLGVLWTAHSGVPGVGTATSKQFVYHSSALGFATGAHADNAAGGGPVAADITWHGDRQAHFVVHSMSGGAKLIDDTGVIESNVDDTASLPTS